MPLIVVVVMGIHIIYIYMCVAIVLVIIVMLYLARTWYQVKGFCADAHCLTMKAISQCYRTITGLTELIPFNKLM